MEWILAQPLFKRLRLYKAGYSVFAGPLLLLLILAMMVLPLPPLFLDLFFTLNIAAAVMVLLVSMYTQRPLDFSAFPVVLLVTTLLRLSLNVASTRIILLEGHTGPASAGHVIEAFGQFVVGGNYAVGIVVFAILTVINFIVVTKGAGRIAEVSARFALDAMPGKQMAIDADLNAGLIGEADARQRRLLVSQEADFFGSMDGASKFVRGDAIAAMIILLINVVGGLIVGVVQHDLPLAEAAKNYTLLSIGDGLVAQIPGLIISIAAGLVVSRVGTDEDTGSQIIRQLIAHPRVLGLTAAILGTLGVVPGMPHFIFIFMAMLMGYFAWKLDLLNEKTRLEAEAAQSQDASANAVVVSSPQQEATWNDVLPVDILGLEVGYRLVSLVDNGGDLLARVKGIRKKFAQEIGFLVPAVHIKDNLELRPNVYRICLKGVSIGEGEAFPGMLLAINPGGVTTVLTGHTVVDPTFGLPALWIDRGLREQALTAGYTVVDASTVIATHLHHLLERHAAELLGRNETQSLVDHIAVSHPKLIQDFIPKVVSISLLQKVLQNLLEESVHIRDMYTVLDTLFDLVPKTTDPNDIYAAVRVALGRTIVQQLAPGTGEISVITLDPRLEHVLQQVMSGAEMALEPTLADNLLREISVAAIRQEQLGGTPILLVPHILRLLMARFLKRGVPSVRVISQHEIPDNRPIKVVVSIGQGL